MPNACQLLALCGALMPNACQLLARCGSPHCQLLALCGALMPNAVHSTSGSVWAAHGTRRLIVDHVLLRVLTTESACSHVPPLFVGTRNNGPLLQLTPVGGGKTITLASVLGNTSTFDALFELPPGVAEGQCVAAFLTSQCSTSLYSARTRFSFANETTHCYQWR
jgi:hypothetical protein